MPEFIIPNLLPPFLEDHKERLELVFLPPYSPELNLVEGLWKQLKSDVINNMFFYSVTEIRKEVAAFMKNIALDAQKIIDRLCLRLESDQPIQMALFLLDHYFNGHYCFGVHRHLGKNQNIINCFGFGGTLVSIILGVVAIFYSI